MLLRRIAGLPHDQQRAGGARQQRREALRQYADVRHPEDQQLVGRSRRAAGSAPRPHPRIPARCGFPGRARPALRSARPARRACHPGGPASPSFGRMPTYTAWADTWRSRLAATASVARRAGSSTQWISTRAGETVWCGSSSTASAPVLQQPLHGVHGARIGVDHGNAGERRGARRAIGGRPRRRGLLQSRLDPSAHPRLHAGRQLHQQRLLADRLRLRLAGRAGGEARQRASPARAGAARPASRFVRRPPGSCAGRAGCA